MNSIPRDLPNPFVKDVVENTWTPPPADVPELHQKAAEKFSEARHRVRQELASASLLVLGSAGSGKTHLVARLRQHLLAVDKSSILAWIRLSCTAADLWRFIRQELVGELLRQQSDGTTALQRLLQNQFPGWVPVQSSPSVFGVLFGGHTGLSLADGLREYDAHCPLHSGLVKVLSILFASDEVKQHAARAWLRGDRLDDADLNLLGLPTTEKTEREDEVEAKEVVRGLCRLAGQKTHLCICFDQVEGLQLGARDLPTLATFATAATDLVADPHSTLLVVTFCRSEFKEDIKVAASEAVWHRLSANSTQIRPLTWEQTFQVYAKRLESQEAIRVARGATRSVLAAGGGVPPSDMGQVQTPSHAATPAHCLSGRVPTSPRPAPSRHRPCPD